MKRFMSVSSVLLLPAALLVFSSCGKDKKNPSDSGKVAVEKITFVSIPGGTFQMGDEVGDLSGGCRPVHTVTISAFSMSEAEITNAQYCAWLNAMLAAGEVTVKDTLCGWDVVSVKGPYEGKVYLTECGNFPDDWILWLNGAFTVESGKENLPVNFVTWFGAKAFAESSEWDLPREAEWEYACRGSKQNLYGTDDGTFSRTKANCFESLIGHLVAVKCFSPTPYGLYDMSGNVYEWCEDWLNSGYYSVSPALDPICTVWSARHSEDANRVMRGGCCDALEIDSRSAARNGFYPFAGSNGIACIPDWLRTYLTP